MDRTRFDKVVKCLANTRLTRLRALQCLAAATAVSPHRCQPCDGGDQGRTAETDDLPLWGQQSRADQLRHQAALAEASSAPPEKS